MRSIALVFVLLGASVAFADDCPNEGFGEARISAKGVTRVVIVGPSKLLAVMGEADAKEIWAGGTRCLPKEEMKSSFRMTATRTGDTVRIDVVVTKHEDWPPPSFSVTLPRSVAVELVMPAGKGLVNDVASVRVAVDEGGIIVSNIAGSVTIDAPRNGPTRVMDVGGDLVLDKSIQVDYERIGGRVISR